MSKNIRDISPFLQKIRNFLMGRDVTLALRFQENLATRSPPLPNIPDGPSHCLSNNYYCKRDGRRLAKPAEVISETKLLESGAVEGPKAVKGRTPGPIFHWD